MRYFGRGIVMGYLLTSLSLVIAGVEIPIVMHVTGIVGAILSIGR